MGFTRSVIALERVGHAYHLPGIRGIGQHLLVAGHGGVEDDLTLAQNISAQRRADEGAAVLEHQRRAAIPRPRLSPPGPYRPPRLPGPPCAPEPRGRRSWLCN